MSSSKKVRQQLKFKQANRDQLLLLPPNIGEWIPKWHPVRFVDELVDRMDISDILATYKSGGTSIYDPKLLLKILFFGYLERTYSSRDLEKACHETIPYLWLCGVLRPDHVTICNFRSGKLKKKIKHLFAQVLREIFDKGLIELKHQTTDGTTIEAVSNRYQYVWRKNAERYKAGTEEKIQLILAEIDSHILKEAGEEAVTNQPTIGSENTDITTNENIDKAKANKTADKEDVATSGGEAKEENTVAKPKNQNQPDKQNNDGDANEGLEQQAKQGENAAAKPSITFREVQDKIAELSQLELEDKKLQKKLNSWLKKLKEAGGKLAKYERQLEILGDRNSYSKTDIDATYIYLKEDQNGKGQVKPAYNIQLSGENGFSTWFSLHQNPNDATNYIDHTEDALYTFDSVDLPHFETANADSIYGTEQNYEYHQEKGMTSYLQFPSYYAERKGKIAKKTFDSRNWYFNAEDNYYVCVMGQRLHYVRSYVRENKSGFQSNIDVYEPLGNCATCPLSGSCLSKIREGSSTDPFNRKRTVHRNSNLEKHLNKARQNLNSPAGKAFRKKRSSEIETHFGQLKGNRRFRRLTHSTIEKVEVEVGLHFTAQNIKKLYQILWLNGNSLLKWREYLSKSNPKATKAAKTNSKCTFLALCTNNKMRVVA